MINNDLNKRTISKLSHTAIGSLIVLGLAFLLTDFIIGQWTIGGVWYVLYFTLALFLSKLRSIKLWAAFTSIIIVCSIIISDKDAITETRLMNDSICIIVTWLLAFIIMRIKENKRKIMLQGQAALENASTLDRLVDEKTKDIQAQLDIIAIKNKKLEKSRMAFLNLMEDLKHEKEQASRAAEKIERNNKFLEEIVFITSHDLQEPVRTMKSFTQLLNEQYSGKLDDKADIYIEYIDKGCDRMKTLITELMDYSRLGKDRFLEHVDCNELLQEVMDDLKVIIDERQAKITVNTLPKLNIYKTEMRLLFQNLIENAIKFTKADVTPRIIISAETNRDSLTFSVQDNAIGIAPEDQEKIFTLFKRLHKRDEYAGTGIGLAHCHRVIDMHEGKIWLESEINKGSTFYFTIKKF